MSIYKKDNLICEKFVLGALDVNSYLVYDNTKERAILIDPADESNILVSKIKELNVKQLDIYLTHGHADHILGVDYIVENFPETKIYISKKDAPMLTNSTDNLSLWLGAPFTTRSADHFLENNDPIKLGNEEGIVKEVPGHTQGGLIFVFDGMVFSGDTLFKDSIGRSDLPGGDHEILIKTIKEEIFSLTDRLVFPGHGDKTTIEQEKKYNPFFPNNAP